MKPSKAHTGAFARYIRNTCYRLGLSINHLSEVMRVHKSNIYMHLRGECKPSWPMCLAYCYAFNLVRKEKNLDIPEFDPDKLYDISCEDYD